METIPGTIYASKESVADFYEVSIGTIDSATSRHKDELVSDGYNSLSTNDFCALHNARVKSKARFISLYTRRSVLRLGMVLRDSSMAKKVRSYLLNIEEYIAPTVCKDELAQMADQVVAQALLIKAVVTEINMAKDGINDLHRKYQDHNQRIAALESLQEQRPTVMAYITQEQMERLRNKVKKLNDKPITVWRKFNKYFSLTRYKFLPQSRFEEALQWLDNYASQNG